MNSRDAAFDESLKEIIEATAAEAAAAQVPKASSPVISRAPEVAEDLDGIPARKKRKRTEDDKCV